MPTARKLMTNTVHSVGTLSIATAERTSSCPLSSEPNPSRPSPLSYGHNAAVSLNGLSTPPWTGHIGFELVKIATATCAGSRNPPHLRRQSAARKLACRHGPEIEKHPSLRRTTEAWRARRDNFREKRIKMHNICG